MIFRRRFGRRRSDERRPIDPNWLRRAAEALALEGFEALPQRDIPDTQALLATGTNAEGARLLLSVSPHSGLDAVLGAVVAAAREDAARPPDEVVAAAPDWRPACHRLLLKSADALPTRLRGLSLPGDDASPPATPAPPVLALTTPAQLDAQFSDARRREQFCTARLALAGLAARSGGALRSAGASLELVLQGTALALLRADGQQVIIELLLPRRQRFELGEDPKRLAVALEQIESQLRRHLRGRPARSGAAAARSRLSQALAAQLDLRDLRRWPVAGAASAIDAVAVTPDGELRLVAGREQLGLPQLSELLHAASAIEPALGVVLMEAAPPLRLATPPRLLLAARRTDAAVRELQQHIALPLAIFEADDLDGPLRELQHRSGAPRRRAQRPAPASAAQRREPSAAGADTRLPPRESHGAAAPASGEPDAAAPRARRRRRRGGRGRSSRASAEEERTAKATQPSPPSEDAPDFEEFSLFELDDAEEPSRAATQRAAPVRAPDAVAAPDLEPTAAPEGETEEADEASLERQRVQRERSERRRERITTGDVEIPEDAALALADQTPARPKGRAAILAHADRASLGAALLLARDLRQVEGLWVYPQQELMTFFRSVATSLRESTPIYIVGFAAKPAREALQAAALYRGRLLWFDHHDWPPEDLVELKRVLGVEATLHIRPGTHSTLPIVLRFCTRRSRFSDKLVDLLSARFSAFDFQSWGRVWWERLGRVTESRGEVLRDVEALIAGRPSELAKEAALAPLPAPPPELAFVAERNLRLVHFGGAALVLVEAPAPLDVFLAARIARERYNAMLSLARREADDVFLLGADFAAARRTVNMGDMIAHLDEKFAWVEALPDEDFVARFRIKNVDAERIEEVIAEIGMGRSILEV